ncbi:MAG: 50S ribosomal protein L15 [Candidatus Omnitrophica bacterium]|nr:50S ribosomal protein L15 [Candidatus Omnitrophota bacterium]MBU1932323.1 50S ribosomal protein L15 [Candidatus Omnitrophota bacterium]
MKIQDLKPAIGARKKRKIVGRGPGSGHGKTSTRGHKGQMSRTGKGVTPGFEGGQMPLIRKMPKRGFNTVPRKDKAVINLDRLAGLEKETAITPELLKKKGVIKKRVNFLKVMGNGEVKIPFNISAHAFSKTAIEKIKNAGGKCEVIK